MGGFYDAGYYINYLIKFCSKHADNKVNGDAKRWCKDDEPTPGPQETTPSKPDSLTAHTDSRTLIIVTSLY